MKNGYIKIARKLFDSDLWITEPFTLGQAWVDLIAMANYATRDHFYKGSVQRIERGQIATSETRLAARWQWSRKKVNTFLRNLERLEMCTAKRTAQGTTITIENYAFYQDAEPLKEQQKNRQSTAEEPQKNRSGTQKKKDKEIKKENIYTPAAKQTEERGDFGGVFLTNTEFDELAALVQDKGEFLAVLDRAGEWLQDNPRPKSRHKSVVKTFLRNDGLL